jgi:hypothetical protein
VGEFGALERNAGEKATWFRQAHDWIAAHPAIAAVVYFNADSTNNGIAYNWRVDTSPASFEGFRYLFTGPAPVPPSPTDTPTTTVPPPDPDPGVLPADNPAAAPKPPKARPGTAPVTGSATADASGAPPGAGATGAGRAPSPRLTWMLQLLRQLDAASVATT